VIADALVYYEELLKEKVEEADAKTPVSHD